MAEHKTQREIILAAAADLLHHEGAGALKVRAIADKAGCSTMGVYSHFEGKDGVIEALFQDGFQRFEQALLAAWDGEPERRMARFGDAYRSWALANQGIYLLMFGGAVPGFVPSDESFAVAAASFETLIAAVAAEQEAGRIKPGDPTDLGWALWAYQHGVVMLQIAGMEPPAAEGHAE
ncbi:MAG: TetR/AcrR family transcriptional regulator, partial [Acidimicrobiales bacterium]|nr:TetR/AcrR family transcriptional regulator [Acidimicrobiales bacterium]